MKNIKEFISEASRNAKNRDVNIIKKIILNGKSYSNIKSFAIFTAQNPDSQKFSNADNKKLYTDLIEKLKNRQLEGLATPKQIRFLEKYGFYHVGLWSFEDASKMITRISLNNWFLPRGIDPQQYQPN